VILDTSMSLSDMAEAPEEIEAKGREKPKGEGCVTITVSNDEYKYTRWLQRKCSVYAKDPFAQIQLEKRPEITKSPDTNDSMLQDVTQPDRTKRNEMVIMRRETR
jgi:hypothetical protein